MLEETIILMQWKLIFWKLYFSIIQRHFIIQYTYISYLLFIYIFFGINLISSEKLDAIFNNEFRRLHKVVLNETDNTD